MKSKPPTKLKTPARSTKHMGDKAIINRLLTGAEAIGLLLSDAKVLTTLPKGVRTQLVVDFKRYQSQVRQAASYISGEKVYRLSFPKANKP